MFDLAGTPRRTIGRAGDGQGEFNGPGGVAITPDGDLFVADFYNNRIQKFAADGTFLTDFGKQGSGAGHFNKAIAAAVAGDGTVFVADHGNHRVQKWQEVD